MQFNGSGNLTERYLNGPSASGVDTVLAEEDVASLASPGTVTWPLTDNLGTVRDIVDSSGAVIDHLVYNSFGQVAYESAPTVHHLQGYTGAIYDADTSMANNWHRWYDPAVGRWISEDPLNLLGDDTNFLRYSANDTTGYIDASGLLANAPNKKDGFFHIGDLNPIGGGETPIDQWYSPQIGSGVAYKPKDSDYTLFLGYGPFKNPKNGKSCASLSIVDESGNIKFTFLLYPIKDGNGNTVGFKWLVVGNGPSESPENGIKGKGETDPGDGSTSIDLGKEFEGILGTIEIGIKTEFKIELEEKENEFELDVSIIPYLSASNPFSNLLNLKERQMRIDYANAQINLGCETTKSWFDKIKGQVDNKK